LTSRSETETRRDPTLKGKAEPQPLQETEGKVATNSPPQTPGRGICNIGNTCFLNATIQCLGAIDEMHQAGLSTQATTTTQDELLGCIRKLQQPGTAYTPASLIKRIPHLIRHIPGDSADAHELLIALINEVSAPLAQIF
jgi:ubiquitin C-terminal hydrolase